jgi:hypothetical protein
MSQYLLLLRGLAGPGATEELSAEEVERFIAPYMAWLAQLKAEQRLVRADRLRESGRRLRPAGLGDAPHIESKDFIGGYYVIRAGSLDEAAEVARACPHLANGGEVEVRELVE